MSTFVLITNFKHVFPFNTSSNGAHEFTTGRPSNVSFKSHVYWITRYILIYIHILLIIIFCPGPWIKNYLYLTSPVYICKYSTYICILEGTNVFIRITLFICLVTRKSFYPPNYKVSRARQEMVENIKYSGFHKYICN